MKDTSDQEEPSQHLCKGNENHAFQIIVLGAGGGPNEDNVSGLLVRSVAAKWSKNSILAVDAGIHLAAIIKIFEEHTPAAIRYDIKDKPSHYPAVFSQVSTKSPTIPPNKDSRIGRKIGYTISPVKERSNPKHLAPYNDPDTKLVLTTGPFKDILLPCESPKANASLLLRTLVSTYLITHPHLDHLAGFAINTAAFHNTSRPKKLAALPGCIDAIKHHIFNDLIWPNLSDEEGGVGFVSYMRLVEGGNVALGDGNGRGYIEVCEGLEVKSFAISHGHCMKKHTHLGSGQDCSTPYNSERKQSRPSIPGSPDIRRNSFQPHEYSIKVTSTPCVIDSSAFFIRCSDSGSEILIFGDVEPDSVSLTPRNERVWNEAAPKVASGLLKAVFIECSYDDSQSDETLFGHLTPRHLAREISILAERVSSHRATQPNIESSREISAIKKRKRQSETLEPDGGRGRPLLRRALGRQSASISPRSQLGPNVGDVNPLSEDQLRARSPPDAHKGGTPLASDLPLAGFKVVVIHIKENLLDSTPVSETVLAQLNDYESEYRSGVEYIIPSGGQSLYF